MALAALLSCLLASSPRVYALNPALDINQYGHTSWTIRDGFFKGRVTVMAQTPDGYLWLGTQQGLLRFDGIRSLPWQPPPGQSLPHNWVRTLWVGRDGTLWIGTLAGLASWSAGTLRRYPDVLIESVDALLEDREGTVWAGGGNSTPSGGRLCALRQNRVQCYGEDGRFGRGVSSLYQDRDGSVWVAATLGLWRWTPGPPTMLPVPGDVADTLQTLASGEAGTPLIASRVGISQVVNGKVEPLSTPTYPGAKSIKLLRDRDGGLWIGGRSGLVHFHRGRADAFAQRDGLSGEEVSRLFEDREGNLWVATLDGLDRFRELAVTKYSVNQGLARAPVAIVRASPDGSVWLNSSGVLNRWKDGRISIYHTPAVDSIFLDSRGRLWLGTRAGVGYLENDRFLARTGAPDGYTSSIAEDSRGIVWVANNVLGLMRVSGDDVTQTPWSALGREDPATRVVADPVRGGLWIGFYKGGLIYYADGRIGEAYSGAAGLAEGRVNDLRVEPDGTLWAATEYGLSRLKGSRVATLTARNGLPCDGVVWTIEDQTGSVWLRTDCGLLRVARADLESAVAAVDRDRAASPTLRATVFDDADGMRTDPASVGPSVDRSTDGTLWFGDNDGVSVVDPRHLPFNALPPPVHVEQFTADHRPYQVAPPTGRDSVRLPALIRDLQIDYTALSLVAPEKVRFRYKLEGWDRDWQDVGTRRQAFYTNLPPRTYSFRVTASNNSGVWNDTGASVDFSVAPAYYQTPWFAALSAGMVLALVWAAHRLRLRVVETHEREISALNERLMKAQEQERIRIAGELHDGVMQQMLAATMMLGTAKRRIRDDADAKAAIDKVQDKLIQVGTDLRQLSHGLHPPMLQEAGLPAAVRAYCEQFSTASGIPVSCDCDESARDLSRGAALALFRIVQEALGNVAKHAQATAINVRLARSGAEVSLAVTDDGVGFDVGRLSASGGLGLVMMRERASQLNGRFEFTSAPGRGTTICVVVPFR